ncbi:MAG TPA: plastocyanin/azurin family copper-binding protein [Stenomitos sp.]
MTKHAWTLIVSLGLVGCGAGPAGGGGGPRPTPSPSYYPPPGGGGGLPGPTPGASTVPMPGPATSAVQVITVENFRFAPAEVTVSPGTVVTWRFMDAIAHTSTSDPGSGDPWESGLLANGQTYSRTFGRTGTFPYHCQPHPTMTGTVVVR